MQSRGPSTSLWVCVPGMEAGTLVDMPQLWAVKSDEYSGNVEKVPSSKGPEYSCTKAKLCTVEVY